MSIHIITNISHVTTWNIPCRHETRGDDMERDDMERDDMENVTRERVLSESNLYHRLIGTFKLLRARTFSWENIKC